jgi:nucleoside-diphosphate-sugar epimerase
MRQYDLIILSGSTGAVGSYVLKTLLNTSSSRILCLLRDQRSYERLVEHVVPEAKDRVETLFADLRIESDIRAGARKVEPASRCLAIHCAADVSWTKPKEVIAPLNVNGTRHFAQLALAISEQRPGFLLTSTAYADSMAGHHRNAYEETKVEAERILRTDFGSTIDICVFRASLVVGATHTGWIGRFNGLYPLIRVIALAEVPCIAGDPRSPIDLVPVDWVTDQMLAAIGRLASGERRVEVVAAAGDSARSLGEVVSTIQKRTRAFRLREGCPEQPIVSVVSARQFAFLMRASKQWGLEQQFYHLERLRDLMEGYVAYATNLGRLDPINVTSPCPAAEDFLPTIIDYWLSVNAAKVLRDRQPAWSPSMSVAI